MAHHVPPRIVTFLAIGIGSALAQVPDAPAPASAPPGNPAPIGQSAPPAPGAGNKPAQASPFGQEIPVLDPGTEVMTFNGKNWNVTNNRIFQARFEKYLNSPESTSKEDVEYRLIIDHILTLLAPGQATIKNVDAAFKLLPYAGRYDIDARLSHSLADAVYSVWQAQRNQARLTNANEALEEAARKLEWNIGLVNAEKPLTRPAQPAGGVGRTGQRQNGGGTTAAVNPANQTDAQTASYTRHLVERLAAIKANQVKKELSELQTKVEFQALMVQYFLQRRFQHVLMATRFYRALFTDGDTKLNLGKDATDLFQKSTGMPPTVSIIDSTANEMLRDVREGVKAFDYLLEKNEMQGATMRMQEVFVIGEYMPEVRLVPREKKRKCLEFAQKGYQLISALDVKDYARAEQLVKDLKKVANDFDDSKPTAAIEGARVAASGKLAKAKQAALNNDQVELEKALTEAATIWPGNPEFKEVFAQVNKQGDVVQKALLEFDQLLSQRNYRQIWNDKVRFIAAVAVNPERKDSLEKVMKSIETIEGSLLRAEEMARQGNYAGAWESLERAWAQFPDDARLNQQRADMTTRASEFVKVVRNAEELEKREQYGSSLAHFLKAQKIYPASDFAKDGIARLVKLVLPSS
jgi:tetratricopeptide (TPR) repeat protein